MSDQMTDLEFAEHELASTHGCKPTRELYSPRKNLIRLAAIAGVAIGDYVRKFSAEGNPELCFMIHASKKHELAEKAIAACQAKSAPPATPVRAPQAVAAVAVPANAVTPPAAQ